jgi:hypothetical protein
MNRLTLAQYPVISHIIRDETEFPSISLAFQKLEGEFWVDRLESPSVAIGVLPKDTFVWGNLSVPGVKPLLARAGGLVADSPGLEPLLQAVWGRFSRVPSVEYRYNVIDYQPSPLPAGLRMTAVAMEHLTLLCAYRPSYRTRETIGDFQSYSDFFAQGFGHAVIDDATGRIVSACMAHAVSARRIDHSLRTLTGYEGMGLATACTHATIMEGVRRGLEPLWITEVTNHGSRAIAEKIGLRLHAEYLLFDRD